MEIDLGPYNWSDVQKVPMFKKELPVLKMDFNKHYEIYMSHLRGLVDKKEISERLLFLTEKLICITGSSYYTWYLRRKCVETLKDIDLENELKFIRSIIAYNEKSYQLWEYRRFIVDRLNKRDMEDEFLQEVFELDHKNYHAWQYKIWLTNRFKTFEKEFDFVQSGLEYDQLNNSVWNFRRFLISKKETFGKAELAKEIAYVNGFLAKKPLNESAWNYLQGFFEPYRFKGLNCQGNPSMRHVFELKDCLEEIEGVVNPILQENAMNKFALALKQQVLLTKGNQKEALMVISQLQNTADKMRKKYWEWISCLILNEMEE